MDWIPHIVVKASTDSCAATTTTALRTFETGFPGHKAIVHYVGTNAETEAFCKKWCSDGGHKFVRYYQSIRQSRLHYEICRGTRLPVVLIRGTAVFYEDMSEYSIPKTKLFGGYIFPAHYKEDSRKYKVISLDSVDKTIIYVSQPIKLINTLNEALEGEIEDVGSEAKGTKKWDSSTIIMDGKIYRQESGIFNMIYHLNTKLFSKFNKQTFANYETVPCGNDYVSEMARAGDAGAKSILGYVNAAMNDDWDKLKGSMQTYIDNHDTVVV